MSTKILNLAVAASHRPKMYTVTGSFVEVACFISGYVSGVALAPAYRAALDEWNGFESWLRARHNDDSTDPIFQMFDQFGDAALATLLERLAEFMRASGYEWPIDPGQSSVAPDGCSPVAPPASPSSAPRGNADIGPTPESDEGDDKNGQ